MCFRKAFRPGPHPSTLRERLAAAQLADDAGDAVARHVYRCSSADLARWRRERDAGGPSEPYRHAPQRRRVPRVNTPWGPVRTWKDPDEVLQALRTYLRVPTHRTHTEACRVAVKDTAINYKLLGVWVDRLRLRHERPLTRY